MNRITLVLIVAVVALAAAAVAGVGRPEAARGDTATPDTVTTVGHGVVTLVPDQAIVTAGVHTQAETASAALAQNGRLMNAVIAALKQAGGKELQTQQVSLYPQTDRDGKVQGWLRLTDGRPPDPLTLLLAADSLPSRDGTVADLTAYVHARPAPGWLRLSRVTTGEGSDAEVWDSRGRLVAQSRRLVSTMD